MANWNKIRHRGNVEDRRGMAPSIAGGISLTGLALLLFVNYLLGGSPVDVLNQLQSTQPRSVQTTNSEEFAGEDSYEVFASTVLGSANVAWISIFNKMNKTYVPPRLVLFRQATDSKCGLSTSQVGPHYCPLDETIYLDETFFDELQNRLGAKGGDVAEAYVIAHEVGHHVQKQLNILDGPRTNEYSILIELQADCFAGLWAHSIKKENVLEPNEIAEAMDAAAAVGDDRIQEKVTGQINPETWTHGSSEQRVAWFNTGYETGSFQACDTFK